MLVIALAGGVPGKEVTGVWYWIRGEAVSGRRVPIGVGHCTGRKAEAGWVPGKEVTGVWCRAEGEVELGRRERVCIGNRPGLKAGAGYRRLAAISDGSGAKVRK